jgi:hypothetical protein
VRCDVWLYVMFDCVMCDCDIWLINSAQMTWNFLFWQLSHVWHSCVMHHWCVTAWEGVREAMEVTTHSHSAVSYAKAQNGVQVNWLESTGISRIQLVWLEYVGECKLLGFGNTAFSVEGIFFQLQVQLWVWLTIMYLVYLLP